MSSKNILALWFGEHRCLVLRAYSEPSWGYRRLGPSRYALDMGRISFLCEDYNSPATTPEGEFVETITFVVGAIITAVLIVWLWGKGA